MKDKEEKIRQDVALCVEQIQDELPIDQKITIGNLVKKHVRLDVSDFAVDRTSLSEIESNAHRLFLEKEMPIFMKIGNKKYKLSSEQTAKLCIVESTVSFLQSHGCLKKKPVFT